MPAELPDRRTPDATILKLAEDLAAVKDKVDKKLSADIQCLNEQAQAMKATLDLNTVTTNQIKEILDGFRTFGSIVKFVCKWVTLLAAAVGAIAAAWHGVSAPKGG